MTLQQALNASKYDHVRLEHASGTTTWIDGSYANGDEFVVTHGIDGMPPEFIMQGPLHDVLAHPHLSDEDVNGDRWEVVAGEE